MNKPLDDLVDFILNTRFEQFPLSLVEQAKRHLLDTLGASLAGTKSEIWQQCVALAEAEGGASTTELWASSLKVTSRQAAWLNGIAAHMYELDDTGGCDHSGAVVVPALMAALPLCNTVVSGKDLITAMIVGYDVGRRVLEACGGYSPHNSAGWHSTATCGVFGAAAAVASLLRISPEQCASAIGISASFSGGLWGFIHNGSHTKKLHAGRAAEGGLQAVMLAMNGISGPVDVFENVWGGFLSTFAPTTQMPEALTADLGKVWKLARCSIKPYASCRGTHAAIDALGLLLAEHPGVAVTEIHVQLNAFLNDMCGSRNVVSMAAAQMSLPYALTARLLYGDANLNSYTDEKRLSNEAHSIMECVKLFVDNTQGNDIEPSVTIITADGESFEKHVAIASGAPANPLTDTALIEKYHQLATSVLSIEQATKVKITCMEIDNLENVEVLSMLLCI